ncbi:hypothetical protein MD484_g6410, partial [Candolleomyces efflorescens]
MSPQFDSAGRNGAVKKIPELVSREMITFVSGTVGPDCTLHCLFKGNRIVVVQSTFLSKSAIFPENKATDPSHPDFNYAEACRATYRTLETIHTLLNSIEFEQANWAFVNQTADGFHISHRRKSFQHLITCPLWAPFIYDTEIDITRWNSDGHANGYWGNKPVDIWYGWDQAHMKEVNKAMNAGRILRGHDLTQEVYGHLLDGESNVIGLVIEATKGRSVQLGDRALLYDAVAKLQRLFCIFAGINAGTVLIHDGKVRFADMCCITYYPPDERKEFEENAERYHWKDLERLFDKLEDGSRPFPHYQFISSQPAVILSNCFSPERPLLAKGFLFCFRGLMDPDKQYDSARLTIGSDAAESDVAEVMRNHEAAICRRLSPCQIGFPVNHNRRHTASTQSDSFGRSRKPSRRIRQQTASPVPIQGYYSKHPALVPRPRHSYQRSVDSDCTSDSGLSRFEEVFDA